MSLAFVTYNSTAPNVQAESLFFLDLDYSITQASATMSLELASTYREQPITPEYAYKLDQRGQVLAQA